MTTETTGYRDGSITGGLTTGIIGTSLGGLALLNQGAGVLGGLFGNNKQNNYITKDEFVMGQELSRKDSEIALLKSEQDSEKKMVDVYKTLAEKINVLNDKVADNKEAVNNRMDITAARLQDKIDANKSFQDGVNTAQVGFNATTGAEIACMQKKLNDISKYSVPWYDVTKAAFVPYQLSNLSSF